jgi:hypothetical protein
MVVHARRKLVTAGACVDASRQMTVMAAHFVFVQEIVCN